VLFGNRSDIFDQEADENEDTFENQAKVIKGFNLAKIKWQVGMLVDFKTNRDQWIEA